MKAGSNKKTLGVLVRLYVKMGAILLFFVIAFQIKSVHEWVVMPFTTLVATTAELLMNIFGAGASVQGNILSTNTYSINIVDGCNGIYATAILVAGILAFPASWTGKLWGVLLGCLAIFVLNQLRVISLFYLGQYSPEAFEKAHVYIWQPIIVVWAIFVWDFWSRKFAAPQAVG